MSRKYERIARKFWIFWRDILFCLVNDNGCIIVEGEKDARILMNLDVPPDKIVTIGDRSIEIVAEEVSSHFDIAYIFTDLDRSGNIKARKLLLFLQDKKIRVVDLRLKFRHYLSRFGFKSLGKIEELKTFSRYISRPNDLIIKTLRRRLYH